MALDDVDACTWLGAVRYEMTDLYDDAIAMLKRLEYAGVGITCPLCRGDGMDERHDPDCELMALIKKMETTPMHCRPIGTADRVNLEHV